MTRAVAVLRPEPGNAATVARIEAAGLRAIRLPLFAVRALAWTPPDPAAHDALLVTSANAVRHAGPGLAALAALPVHAVGEASAAAARAAGLRVVATGGAGVDAALALAAADGIGRALHLAGRHRTERALPGIVARTIAVYANDAIDPGAAALAALDGAVALVHSARAARWLRDLLDRHGPPPATVGVAAIGAAVLAAAGGGWAGAASAERPTDAALVAVARALAD